MISRSLRQGGCTSIEYGLLTKLIRPKRTALPGTVLMDCWQSSPVESTSVLHSGYHWSGLPMVPGPAGVVP